MKKWRTQAFLLLMLVLVVVVAACGDKENDSSTGSDQATEKPSASEQSANSGGEQKKESAKEEAAVDEPITIRWLSFDPPESDDSPVQQYLEEKFNVKFENMRVDRSSWREHLNIRLASKEVPDLFFLWSGEEIMEYSRQGLLAELPVELIREKMPQYAATIDELDASLWNNAVVGDQNFAIPLYWLDGLTPFLPVYNGDWLNNLGVTDPPNTLEEYEELLYRFTFEDPDGNGKDDTYGLSGRGKDSLSTLFNSVFSAYGVTPTAWVETADGKLQLGITTEEAREAFRKLNKWYVDGVIDKEFITADYAKIRQDLATRRAGAFDAGMWNSYKVAIIPEFQGQNPDTELVVGGPLLGPSGKQEGFSWGMKNNFIGMGIQVEKDEKKRDKIFEILDALANDEETYLTTYFGIEGESYEMEDGVPKLYEAYVNPTERGAKLGAGSYYNLFGSKSMPMAKFDLPVDQAAFKKQVTTGKKAFNNKLTFIVPEQSQYPDLGRIRDEHIIKFILGEVDLDKGFDDFVSLWYASGGEALTKAVNDRYEGLK